MRFTYAKDRLQNALSRSRWKLLPGTEPLPIVPLISPLRYDIVVRLEYLRFLEANIAWFARDFPSYVEAARKTGYFVWFTEVMCRNFRPRLLHTERKLQRAFEHRLRKTTRMYLRFLKSGFDRRFPVLLNTGDRILETDTGKHIICRYYAGDGCHRIALLLLAGESVLQAETYYVRCFRHYAPRDNTARLVQTLSLEPEKYFAFLSIYYANQPFYDGQSLLAQIEKENPSKLEELRKVIAIDWGQ
jgi:hypothetical protein